MRNITIRKCFLSTSVLHASVPNDATETACLTTWYCSLFIYVGSPMLICGGNILVSFNTASVTHVSDEVCAHPWFIHFDPSISPRRHSPVVTGMTSEEVRQGQKVNQL